LVKVTSIFSGRMLNSLLPRENTRSHRTVAGAGQRTWNEANEGLKDRYDRIARSGLSTGERRLRCGDDPGSMKMLASGKYADCNDGGGWSPQAARTAEEHRKER
jgi:hypothetical protein